MSQDTPQNAPKRALPSGPLTGRVRVPGDKSISHRALMLGGLAHGTTRVSNLLDGDDVMSTLGAMRALGADIRRVEDANIRRDGDIWVVDGVGGRGFATPDAPLDLGNAGTGVRLLMGLVAGQGVGATFIGDESLSGRPMARVLDPLREMGARADAAPGDRLPATLHAGRLSPIAYTPKKASAQVKSCVLLAGLGAKGTTTVVERTPTRAHTESLLEAFGVPVSIDGEHIRITGPARLAACDIDVPGDPSSAAFATVAALVMPGSDILLQGVMVNPRRDRLYFALVEMGADITATNFRREGGETVADLRVRHSELHGITVDPALAADMIDEYPVLAVAAAFARGTTVMDGIHELRVKESDRISATVAMLRGNGVEVEEREDGMSVTGGPVPGGGTAITHHDHRIAMSALVLGLASDNGASVDDSAMIATSYPGFFSDMEKLGARFG